MKKFQDKVVCITGSSSGIGEATAYRFAEEGAKLLLIALEEDKLLEVKQKCLQLGAPDVEIFPYNLADLENLPALMEQAWNRFGHIDVMYNNAGISQRTTFVQRIERNVGTHAAWTYNRNTHILSVVLGV